MTDKKVDILRMLKMTDKKFAILRILMMTDKKLDILRMLKLTDKTLAILRILKPKVAVARCYCCSFPQHCRRQNLWRKRGDLGP